MSTQFDIRTLLVGELELPCHDQDSDWHPIHAWYVTDGTRRILVDSGMPSSDDIRRRLNIGARSGGSEGVIRALAAIDVDVGSIDTVVLTHLHFDHAWNLELFPTAQIVVQRDELFHAVDPVPTQRTYYLRETAIELLKRKRPRQLRLVDGDLQLLDGVQLLKAPGHTPGMQAVAITTAKGVVGLVADLGDEYGYWYPSQPAATVKPMNSMADTVRAPAVRSGGELECIRMMDALAARVDIIVPAHDYRIPRSIPQDWYKLPSS